MSAWILARLSTADTRASRSRRSERSTTETMNSDWRRARCVTPILIGTSEPSRRTPFVSRTASVISSLRRASSAGYGPMPLGSGTKRTSGTSIRKSRSSSWPGAYPKIALTWWLASRMWPPSWQIAMPLCEAATATLSTCRSPVGSCPYDAFDSDAPTSNEEKTALAAGLEITWVEQSITQLTCWNDVG